MPLFLLGLIVLIGCLIYAIISYRQSGKQVDSASIMRGNNHKEHDSEGEEHKTLFFPTENIDTEKHKRNIH